VVEMRCEARPRCDQLEDVLDLLRCLLSLRHFTYLPFQSWFEFEG
jgi:hypothetical protein